MNTELLNAVAKFLSESGVQLKNDDATRSAIIGLCINTLVKSGVEMENAFDIIMGNGQFRKLADSVWERIQSANA
jgi:hypothetical protein